MFCRSLFLILLCTSRAIAQSESFAEIESRPAPPETQTTPPTESALYRFEIRFISADEEFILPLRKLKKDWVEPIEPIPFSTWSPLDSASPVRVQKIETQVLTDRGMSVVELSEKQAFELFQRAQGDSRTNIIYAPKVYAALGQTAVVSDGSVKNLPRHQGAQPATRNATTGVQVHLRTNALKNGSIQADSEIVLVGRATDDQNRFERTTISFSGILRKESLTMIVVPDPLPELEPMPESAIQRVSNVVRFRKSETHEPTQLLIMISVVAPKEN